MEGDIQEQRGTFEACGQAACRGWTVRFARKMGFVAGALFFCFVFFPQRDAYGMGVQKKMKTGLRTTKSRVYCSFQGWHYPKHPKNIAQLAKIKRSTIKGNFQGHAIFSALSSKSAVSNKPSTTPYFVHCQLPTCRELLNGKYNSSFTSLHDI